MSSRDSSLHSLLRLPLSTEVYLGICAVLFTVLYFFVPMQNDDLWFTEPYFPYLRGEAPFSLADGFPSLRWHYLYDNSRLPNLTTPVTLVLFPRWLFNILCGMMVWIMLRFAVLMSTYPGRQKVSGAGSVIVITLYMILLPWNQYMLVGDFSLNYVWTAAFVTFCMYTIMRPEIFRCPAWPWKVIICIVMLLSGAMHEAASSVTCIGAALVILTDLGNRKNTRVRILLLFLFAIGTVWVCLSPVTLAKLASGISAGHYFSIPSLLRASTIPILSIATIIVVVLIPELRRKISRSQWRIVSIYMVMTGLSALLMFYSGSYGDRVMWFADVFAGTGICTLLNPICRSRKWWWLAAPMAVFTIVHMGVAIYYQARLMNEYRKVTSIMRDTRANFIVYTPTTPRDMFPLDLRKPMTTAFHFHYDGVLKMYARGRRVSLVPHLVSRTPIDSMRRVAPHFRVVGDYVVMCDTILHPRILYSTIKLRFSDGSATHDLSSVVHPFIRNGRQYYYFDTPRSRLLYGLEIDSVILAQ